LASQRKERFAGEYQVTQRHFISYPKSGRTWLRYIFVQLALDSHIQFHHDLFEFNNSDKPPHNFDIGWRMERYSQIDKLVYLQRDPRDLIVSLYFQVTGRFSDFFSYKGTISEFIRDDYFGAENLHRFRCMWETICSELGFLTVSYEHCHRDMEGAMFQLLEYYQLPFDRSRVSEAVANAEFDKMQKLEESAEFPKPWLRPRNGALKVRKGKVGGFREVLDKEDITYLNSRFGITDNALPSSCGRAL
jgi:hypothetical protein